MHSRGWKATGDEMSKSERIKGKISLVLNDSMEGKELVKLKQQHNCDYQV